MSRVPTGPRILRCDCGKPGRSRRHFPGEIVCDACAFLDGEGRIAREVIGLMREIASPLAAPEIARELDLNPEGVANILRRLHQRGRVKRLNEREHIFDPYLYDLVLT